MYRMYYGALVTFRMIGVWRHQPDPFHAGFLQPAAFFFMTIHVIVAQPGDGVPSLQLLCKEP